MAAAVVPRQLSFAFMFKGQAIGVVDDDESVRESLTGMLESLGFLVRPFPSAEAFLAADDLTEVGCLILDVSMPGMNGEDLQKHLIAAGRRLPILFISADADEALQRRLLERGAIGYVVKPFEERDLLAAVSTVAPSQAAGDP